MFDVLVGRLPAAIQPYAKAILPAIGTIIAVVVQWAATGDLDRSELATAITGLAASIVTFLAPNQHVSDPGDLPPDQGDAGVPDVKAT